MEGSFLDSDKYKLGEVEWGEDDCGDFWSAPFLNRHTGKQLGITGSYYDVDENNRRLPKAEQEAELKSFAASA